MSVIEAPVAVSSLSPLPEAAFQNRSPIEWSELSGFLTQDAFQALHRDFPPLDRFIKQVGMARSFDQRPHDRYHLAYGSSIYKDADAGAGVISHEELAPSWQAFINELEGEGYRRFIAQLFGVEEYEVRYAWHVAFTGCEVSPHLDGPKKLGTQLFYFNTAEDWKPEWGGSTSFLYGKKVARMNPEVAEFERAVSTSIIDNRSCIFKNGLDAWHAVLPLTCPEGSYRRLFTVVFDRPKAWAPDEKAPVVIPDKPRSLLSRIKTRLLGK